MIVCSSKSRKVTIEENEDGFLLIERTRYVPHGYTKGRWDESRIWLSKDELAKVAQFNVSKS